MGNMERQKAYFTEETKMRQLAKIVTVRAIEPIEGADKIELAKIDGWQCVAKKNQFKVGQDAVYFEYDSMLPLDDDRFSFLAGRNEYEVDNKRYARIKTLKLRKVLSQGLLMPLEILPDNVSDSSVSDLAECFGVIKYEPKIPTQLAGNVKGSFPVFIRKTDQERVNNLSKEYAQAIANEERFEVTVKLDGSSITCFCYAPKDHVGVCSRNLELKTDQSNCDNTYVKMFKQKFEQPLLYFMRNTGRSIALQGEICGPGIQGNFEGLDEVDVYIFDVFDIDQQRYLLPDERRKFINDLENSCKILIKNVPILSEESLLPKTVEECIISASGKSGLKGKYREGLVYKSLTRDFSFKAISVDYLLLEK